MHFGNHTNGYIQQSFYTLPWLKSQDQQTVVCSTKIYLTSAGLTWQVKNMPAAGTISFLFQMMIFTPGFKHGSSM